MHLLKVARCFKPHKDGGFIPLTGIILAHTQPLSRGHKKAAKITGSGFSAL